MQTDDPPITSGLRQALTRFLDGDRRGLHDFRTRHSEELEPDHWREAVAALAGVLPSKMPWGKARRVKAAIYFNLYEDGSFVQDEDFGRIAVRHLVAILCGRDGATDILDPDGED